MIAYRERRGGTQSTAFFSTESRKIPGLVLGCGMDGRGVGISFMAEATDFLCTPQRPDRLWVSPSLQSNGYGGPFLQGVKRQGVKLSSAEVKNGGYIPPFSGTTFPLPSEGEWQTSRSRDL
jgi:hypothetical protein